MGVEIMIGDTAASDGDRSGEGKPKARVKVRKYGRECLHTPVGFASGRNQAAYFGRNSRENGLYQ
jgi:hypothetical protein